MNLVEKNVWSKFGEKKLFRHLILGIYLRDIMI